MFIILGLGEQAKAIIHYIIEKTDEEIVSIDIKDFIVEERFKYRWTHFNNKNLKLGETFSLLLNNKNTKVINCLPTEYIIEATKLAIEKGWNIVDLAGETEIEREQQKLESKAVSKGSVVVHGAGIAPGIVSSMTKDIVNKFKEDIIGIKIFCGGVPKYPDYPLSYIRVFNESGVIKEYTGLADEIRDYTLVKTPALSDREYVFIPSLGIMEADITTGGISTTLDDLDIEYFSYKTLRYPGHFNYVKFNILTQPNPQKILEGLIKPVSAFNPDIIVLYIMVETTEGFEHLRWFWEYDYENNISAMSQAIGYIAAEVALQTDEMKPGIYNMDSFNSNNIRNKVREIREEGNFSKQPINFIEE